MAGHTRPLARQSSKQGAEARGHPGHNQASVLPTPQLGLAITLPWFFVLLLNCLTSGVITITRLTIVHAQVPYTHHPDGISAITDKETESQ